MAPFRTILVAADFSARSKEAFHVACALAEETKTRILVLHVVERTPIVEQLIAIDPPGSPIPLLADGTPRRDGLAEQLRESYSPNRPINVQTVLCDGAPADEILAEAVKIGADLVVLGTHGRTGLRRLLTGSVAEAVVRRAACPVLAVHAPDGRPTEAGAIRVILHPTDFSDQSVAALRVARALASAHGAHLLLLHVEPIEMMSGVALAPPLDPDTYYVPLMQLRAKTEGPDLKYPVEIQCERGDPATDILRVADQIHADLIVLGSHGRGALGRLLMGSVAEAVLRRANCPTLIVKHAPIKPAEAPAEPSQTTLTVF